MNRFRAISVIALLALLVLGLPGCSGKSGESASSEQAAASRYSADDKPATTADEAIVRVAHALADGRPEVAWDALPPSYQKDVTDLLHQAASQADPELWNRSFTVLGKVSRVLSEKRDFVFDHPMVATQIKDRDEAEQGWDAVVGLFQTIVQSDLADPDKVRQLDVRQFLSGTGSEVMGQVAEIARMADDYSPNGDPMQKLRDVEATVVSSSGDTARVRIEAPGAPPTEEEYVRVEGRWLSKELVDEWPQTMAKAREGLAEYSAENSEEEKQAAMMQLAMIETAVDGLLAANSSEEFNARIGAVMGMAMGAMMAQAANEADAGMASMAQPAPMARFEPAPAAASSAEIGSRVAASMPPPKPARGSADRRPKYPDFIPVDDAAQYVGQRLHVLGTDGTDMTARLIEVRQHILIFERELGGGSIALEMAKGDVEQLQLRR